jgi:hypothetical protein
MQLTTLLTCSLLSLGVTALPDFVIATSAQRFTATNSAEYAKITKAVIDAASSYQATKTAQPEWSSMVDALIEYQKTGKNVPEGVTATDRILTFTTTPDWYVPNDVSYWVSADRDIGTTPCPQT